MLPWFVAPAHSCRYQCAHWKRQTVRGSYLFKIATDTDRKIYVLRETMRGGEGYGKDVGTLLWRSSAAAGSRFTRGDTKLCFSPTAPLQCTPQLAMQHSNLQIDPLLHELIRVRLYSNFTPSQSELRQAIDQPCAGGDSVTRRERRRAESQHSSPRDET